MELPKKCKERIMQLYSIDGRAIIANSEKVIDKIIKKYKLEDAKILDNMSYNIIIDAYSRKFKNVIVKIGINKEVMDREIDFYNIYTNNQNVCKVYDYNKEMNYLVMKKASTALKLDDIKGLNERIKIYKNIFQSLNEEPKMGVTFPKYQDMFKKSADGCKEIFLQENIEFSKKLIQELENRNLKKYILHGDMHHWNIVLDDNKWKLIDPARICCMQSFRFGGFFTK